jgi:putative MATE family efflux protein
MSKGQGAPSSRIRELTVGNVGRQVFSLAVPATIESALQTTVRLMDTYWMGRVGGMAVASVAMATALRMVLISPMMGLSMGGQAIVSRYVGERDQERADRAVMQVLLLIALFTLPITVLGYTLTPALLRLMGASEAVLPNATAFLRIIWGGLFFMECLPTMCGVLKGAGRPEYTLRINMLNMAVLGIAEPILALGLGPVPAMGIRGAALASVMGAASGVLGVMLILGTGQAGVRLHLRDIRPDWTMMKRVLRISIPASVERFSPNLGAATFMRLISYFGDQVLTAYSIFHQIYGFFQAATMGAGLASATMVGQNLGAGKPERAEQAAKSGAKGATMVSLVLYGTLALAPQVALVRFTQDPVVINAAALAIRVTVIGSAIRGFGQVMGRSLAGAGDAVSPMAASIGALWIVQLPVAWLLSGLLGPLGIWIGMVLGDTAHAIATTWRFGQGKWKAIRV